MKWATAVSDATDLGAALDELQLTLREALDGPADLALVFVTWHHRHAFDTLGRTLREAFGNPIVIGCSAAGVLGGGREVEGRRGITVCLAQLPGVRLTPFHLESESALPNLDAAPGAWSRAVGVTPSPDTCFLLLVDGGTFDPQDLLLGLDFAFPGAPKVGGLASAIPSNVLFWDERTLERGALGLALQGNICLDPIVAQGCRPLADPMTITQCQRHLLEGVDGRPPVEVLADLYEGLSVRDRSLLQSALHLGIATHSLQGDEEEEYLIRNVMGADPERGALAVAANLRIGQRVQFQVRDAETAEEELRALLLAYTAATAERASAPSSGALLFACTGRGARFFGEPDFESRRFGESQPGVPLGGFFCGGEVGPLGGETRLYGYTSAFAVFRPRQRP